MATWRRKRKRQQWFNFVEYSGNTHEEATMAAGGSVTVAYRCRVVDETKLATEYTSMLRTECAAVDDAVQRLNQGETVTVAGSDMGQLRSRLASFGIG